MWARSNLDTETQELKMKTMTALPARQLDRTGMDITHVGFGSWAVGGDWAVGWGS
jgi:hypothetical protein